MASTNGLPPGLVDNAWVEPAPTGPADAGAGRYVVRRRPAHRAGQLHRRHRAGRDPGLRARRRLGRAAGLRRGLPAPARRPCRGGGRLRHQGPHAAVHAGAWPVHYSARSEARTRLRPWAQERRADRCRGPEVRYLNRESPARLDRLGLRAGHLLPQRGGLAGQRRRELRAAVHDAGRPPDRDRRRASPTTRAPTPPRRSRATASPTPEPEPEDDDPQRGRAEENGRRRARVGPARGRGRPPADWASWPSASRRSCCSRDGAGRADLSRSAARRRRRAAASPATPRSTAGHRRACVPVPALGRGGGAAGRAGAAGRSGRRAQPAGSGGSWSKTSMSCARRPGRGRGVQHGAGSGGVGGRSDGPGSPRLRVTSHSGSGQPVGGSDAEWGPRWRRGAAEHRRGDEPGGVQVLAGVRRRAGEQLGGQVAGGADHLPGQREPVQVGGGGDAEVGEPEVGPAGPGGLEQQVGRLHVAVDEAGRVHGRQRVEQLVEQDGRPTRAGAGRSRRAGSRRSRRERAAS